MPSFRLPQETDMCARPKVILAEPTGGASGVVPVAVRGHEVSLDDGLEHQMVIITAGEGAQEVEFTVHRKLLYTHAVGIDALIRDLGLNDSQSIRLPLGDENPAVVRSIVGWLHNQAIPKVDAAMSAAAKISCITLLVQLYLFSEDYIMRNEFSNRIMDALQDGFFCAGSLPSFSLIVQIFNTADPTSILRSFCAHTLHFNSHIHFHDPGAIHDFLQQNKEIKDEYDTASKTIGRGDPRLRDCNDDDRCLQCVSGKSRDLGYWPCQFHQHDMRHEDGTEAYDFDCYLWRQD